jgi:hypothetical protein
MHPPLGLVVGVDLIGSRLKEVLHQLIGWFENGRRISNCCTSTAED